MHRHTHHPPAAEVDPADRRDIEELRHKVAAFRRGEIPEERFKHYRLTRGVYGQRQPGVHMFRIKIPYGRLTARQLARIADLSEKYATGNLHLTTRQNIQFHYVKLEDSVALWEGLAEVGLNAREACGNTVRNLTASARAGIDPDEPFDVSPYAHAAWAWFLRNPVCQDMGRKVKIAFSSSDKDAAFTWFHDFGFVPRLRVVDGRERRGFKVVVGGGLDAQSMPAQTAFEFLEEEHIIPFLEAAIRVFDRYGEREKRMKARLKFLVKKLGLPAFLELVEKERRALPHQTWWVDRELVPPPVWPPHRTPPEVSLPDTQRYHTWLQTNVFAQKQPGYFGVQLRVPLGNIDAATARALAALVRQWAADDIRITVNQGLLLRFVRPEVLPFLFTELDRLGLAAPGFDTLADITSCPGTDTCALGVTNSTALAARLEEVIWEEFPDLISESHLHIKISGCMNSCGQHMAAQIGFHGSSIRHGQLVLPAMQVVLGGGNDPDGTGHVAEKVVKLPTRTIPDALRAILSDYEQHAGEGEYFNAYYRRRGKRHFYELLKPLATADPLPEEWLRDWGQAAPYVQQIGVGECAGAAYDMVAAIVADAHERLDWAREALQGHDWASAIYHAYTAMVVGAKALLLAEDVRCNTHKGILEDFDRHLVETRRFPWQGRFEESVLEMHRQPPHEAFAWRYFERARTFLDAVRRHRAASMESVVLRDHYKA